MTIHLVIVVITWMWSARRISSDLIDDGQTVSHNATRDKAGNERANIFVANGVFK